MKVRLPGMESTLSVHFLFVLLGILELSLAETLVIGCSAVLVQSVWKTKRKPQPIQVVFNVSATASPSGHVFRLSLLEPSAHRQQPAPAADRERGGLLSHQHGSGCDRDRAVRVQVPARPGRKPISGRFLSIWLERPSSDWCISRSALLAGKAPCWCCRSCTGSTAPIISTWAGWRMKRSAWRSKRMHVEAEKRHVEEVCALHLRTIEGLALAIDAKDHTTHAHLHRVRTYAVEIGQGPRAERSGDGCAARRRPAARHRQAGGARSHHQQARPPHSRKNSRR